MRADWVYRGDQYRLDDPSSVEPAFSGSYYSPITLAVGSSTAQVLYDSNDYIGSRYGGVQVIGGANRRMSVGSEARPDRAMGGPLIHGVDVHANVRVNDSAWTTNLTMYLAMRIVVAEQDPETGRMVADVNYSMWSNISGFQSGEPAVWANGRQNCWETRIVRSRRTTDVALDMFIDRRVRFKRRLDSQEGLFLYLETHTASVNLNLVNLWCRTLVTDVGKT